jgi:signal transduction histidine kinase
MSTATNTDFSPAEIDSPETVTQQRAVFLESSNILPILDAVPDIIMILNDKRQLVLGNQSLQEITQKSAEELTGLRPGEILGCIHALKSQSGCGTTPFCRYCGAAKAILSSLHGNKDLQECRILRQEGSSKEALDLRVSATPFTAGGYDFSVFHVTDISHEKRREVLERIFFHDILNSAGSIQGIMQVLGEQTSEDNQELAKMAEKQCRTTVEQIQAQKDIMAAEKKDLQVHPEQLQADTFLTNIKRIYSEHLAAEGKEIRILPAEENTLFATDPKLLSRVLENMLKNALEASATGQTVTMGTKEENKEVLFWVHNSTHMPEETQSQIFKRSFSTKGKSRGLGTYSIRLLSEEYLGGKVWFESTPEKGTTFYLKLKKDTDSA